MSIGCDVDFLARGWWGSDVICGYGLWLVGGFVLTGKELVLRGLGMYGGYCLVMMWHCAWGGECHVDVRWRWRRRAAFDGNGG